MESNVLTRAAREVCVLVGGCVGVVHVVCVVDVCIVLVCMGMEVSVICVCLVFGICSTPLSFHTHTHTPSPHTHTHDHYTLTPVLPAPPTQGPQGKWPHHCSLTSPSCRTTLLPSMLFMLRTPIICSAYGQTGACEEQVYCRLDSGGGPGGAAVLL